MAKVIDGKKHRENLNAITEALNIVNRIAIEYADGNIRHNQVTPIFDKMGEIKTMSDDYINLMEQT